MGSRHPKTICCYPAFLNIQGKRSVVVGGGKVALRKIKMLLDCGASVTVISPRPHPEIAELSKERAIHLIQRDYEAGDLKDAFIVIACTDLKGVNRRVAHEAMKARVLILINVADDPKLSNFIIPSLFRRGSLTVAVSTGGVSPALAKRIRTKLEQDLGEEYALLVSLIGEIRSTIKEKKINVDAETWQKALDLDLLVKLLREGEWGKAKSFLLERLEDRKKKQN